MKATTHGAYGIFLHVALVVLCVLTLVLGYENRRLTDSTRAPSNGPSVGQAVGSFHWQPLDAEAVTVGPPSGGRERLLFVFTTDCPACRDNQVGWRTVHRQVGGALDVYGVSLSDLEATRAYRDAHALPFAVGVAVDPAAFAASFAVSFVPLTLQIGADGRILGSWSGTLSDRQLAEIVASARG